MAGQMVDVVRSFADWIERETSIDYVDVNFYTSKEKDIRCLLVYEGNNINAEGNRWMIDVNVSVRIRGEASRWERVLLLTQELINNVRQEYERSVIIGETERNGSLLGNTSDEFETETSFRLCSRVGFE